MDGKPYAIRSTNGPNVLYDLLSDTDKGKSVEEIARTYAGLECAVALDPIILSPEEISEANKSQFDLHIPELCEDKSHICLKLDTSDTSMGGSKFDLEFYLNGGTSGSVAPTTNLETGGSSDPRLLKAMASATGCIQEGIKENVKFDLEGHHGLVNYDATPGDQSPAQQTYQVVLSLRANVGFLGHGTTLAETDGSRQCERRRIRPEVRWKGREKDGFLARLRCRRHKSRLRNRKLQTLQPAKQMGNKILRPVQLRRRAVHPVEQFEFCPRVLLRTPAPPAPICAGDSNEVPHDGHQGSSSDGDNTFLVNEKTDGGSCSTGPTGTPSSTGRPVTRGHRLPLEKSRDHPVGRKRTKRNETKRNETKRNETATFVVHGRSKRPRIDSARRRKPGHRRHTHGQSSIWDTQANPSKQ
ncbi:unnamed protein product [Pseudo-nitzschia multistriata]|uniref:Uncharacterized protein n=1 Tax=Pseudo-nitzschia multistriata TaxID=183589 RepID=A0A448Z9B6_9STRA|nr:unnamed protein product [Pseudo-nitzschia multistriata]